MVKAEYLFTSENAGAWTGGRVLGNISAAVQNVEVDSRRCGFGTLFVALKGERADGHDYIAQIIENGAVGAVASKLWAGTSAAHEVIDSMPAGVFILIVEDPLTALQQMAAEYMKLITKPVRIGVTGSNGKTTTKELIASVLSERYSVVKTAGNYNSEIGLPLTVFKVKNDHDYAVIEMGINRLGEMDILAEILRPDLVVITNIGTAHIGIFKNIETIAYEKRRSVSLFNGAGTLFVSEDETFIDFMSEGLQGQLVSYGRDSLGLTYGKLSSENKGLKGWKITLPELEIDFPLVGEHNLKNAFCAFALGRYAGLTDTEIKSGLEKSEPLFGRSEIIDGPVTIIQDCYNANADSMFKSIDFADSLEWPDRKIYVLGDMKELGENSLGMHKQAGSRAAESSADLIFFFGDDTAASYSEAERLKLTGTGRMPVVFHTDTYEVLESELISNLKRGDLLLLKGSRSMNLERLVEPVQNVFRGAEC